MPDLEAGFPTIDPQAHPAGAGVYLAGHEVDGHQRNHPAEGDGSVHQVVLMGPPAGPLPIHVVFIEPHTMRGPLPTGASCRSGHEKVSGPVIGKGLEGIGGLRRGVLGMGMINVDATAIGGQHIHQGRLG